MDLNVRLGREHDTTCQHVHDEMLPVLRESTGDDPPALADLVWGGNSPHAT